MHGDLVLSFTDRAYQYRAYLQFSKYTGIDFLKLYSLRQKRVSGQTK